MKKNQRETIVMLTTQKTLLFASTSQNNDYSAKKCHKGVYGKLK